MQQTLCKRPRREKEKLIYILGTCLKYHFENNITLDILRKHNFCIL